MTYQNLNGPRWSKTISKQILTTATDTHKQTHDNKQATHTETNGYTTKHIERTKQQTGRQADRPTGRQ